MKSSHACFMPIALCPRFLYTLAGKSTTHVVVRSCSVTCAASGQGTGSPMRAAICAASSSEMLRPRLPSCSSHACARSALHLAPSRMPNAGNPTTYGSKLNDFWYNRHWIRVGPVVYGLLLAFRGDGYG